MFYKKAFDFVNASFNNNKTVANSIFSDYIENCYSFVFTKQKETEELSQSEELLDLPFPVVCIELLHGVLATNQTEEMLCFFAKEAFPGNVSFLTFIQDLATKDFIVKKVDKNTNKPAWDNLNGILKHYLDRLDIEKTAVDLKRNKEKVGVGSFKRFYKPKPIIYVFPKKYTSEIGAMSGKSLDFNHAFAVRGHWRKVDGIGKDRNGEYVVKGFTWVVPSVRNKDKGIVVKKTYVVDTLS
jgi:hypothetical protein